jgi:hypothetical protein
MVVTIFATLAWHDRFVNEFKERSDRHACAQIIRHGALAVSPGIIWTGITMKLPGSDAPGAFRATRFQAHPCFLNVSIF